MHDALLQTRTFLSVSNFILLLRNVRSTRWFKTVAKVTSNLNVIRSGQHDSDAIEKVHPKKASNKHVVAASND